MSKRVSIKNIIACVIMAMVIAAFLPWGTAYADENELAGCTVGSILRTDAENAKLYIYIPELTLSSVEQVKVYYLVNGLSDAPGAVNPFSVSGCKNFIATCGMNNQITLTSEDGMSEGPKKVTIEVVVEDIEGNYHYSKTFEAKLPYDVYYTEDFETYDVDTYLANENTAPSNYLGKPFLYLYSVGVGNGQTNQKIVASESETKYLTVTGTGGPGVDACVSFGNELENGFYVYEADVLRTDEGKTHGYGRSAIYAGKYQRMNEQYNGGVYGYGVVAVASYINGEISYLGAKSQGQYIEIGYMPQKEYKHFKLVIDNYNKKYSVYVDGKKWDQNNLSETDDLRYNYVQTLNYIGIYDATGTSHYDNLLFYKTNGVPIPTAIPGLKANSTEQTGVDYIADEGFYTYEGTVKATEGGSYSATFTLKEGYVWEDGTTEPKTVNWKIKGDTAILTIKSYDGSETLAEIPVPKKVVEGGTKDVYEAFITDENEKFAAYMFSNEPEGEINIYVKDLYLTDIIYNDITHKDEFLVRIYDDLTLYAKPPIRVNKVLNYDFSNGKTVTITGSELIEAGGPSYFKGKYFADDSTNDFLFYFYYSTMINEMWYDGEFDKAAGTTIFENKDVIFDYDYYLTPVPSDSEKLAEADVFLADQFFGPTSIYTHISIEPEEDSVMKIHMSKNEDGKTVMTLSGVECDTVKEATVLSLGIFPKDLGLYELVLSSDELLYYIFDSCNLNIKYGNDLATTPTPEPTPTADPSSSPEPVTSPEPSASPETTASPSAAPTENPADDLTSIFPEAENITVEEKQAVIENANTDKGDVEGSTMKFLMLKGTPKKNNAIELTWKSIKQADGYIIYGSKCGTKMKYITTISKPAAKSFTIKKLKKGTYYKYMVVAYKTTPSGDKVLTSSKSVHVATGGSKKGNPSKLTVKKSKLKVKKGKTVKIKAKVKNPKGKKVSTHIAKVRYESSDPSVATVTKTGKVKGIAKGTAKIYVYSQNGICKTVKITVK